jgi:hypothetical protein
MLQAPTTESKERRDTGRTSAVPEPQRTLHPPYTGMDSLNSTVASGHCSAATQVRQHFVGLQRNIGNQAVLRMLSRSAPTIQTKLTVNQPGDQYEQEADRVAEQVMRMPDPAVRQLTSASSGTGAKLQRKCACGGSGTDCPCKDKQEEGTLQRKAQNISAVNEAPPIVHEVLRAPGRPMDAATMHLMERRLAYNFGGVRIHNDAQASESARAVQAFAYTVGNHVVFASGRYNLATRDGSHLLAHELAHVVQQGATRGIPNEIPITDAHGPAESEAEHAAHFASGASALVPQHGPVSLARFSDTGHHIVEEAGLAGAGFNEEEMKWIERGNVQRDYSQIPVGKVGNALLLCKPSDFGGYSPKEHFDNYLWDAVAGGWKTRGASAFGDQGLDTGRTPIDYIGSQLEELADRDVNKGGLVHLGNAFHTVEDFFAHSNFVELIQGDTSRGSTLMTGNPVGPSQSVTRIFEAITPRGISEHYHEQSEEAIRSAAPGTHTIMAHDDPQAPNYTLARRLAALVVQDLGTDVLAVMSQPQNQRAQLMRERVVSKVIRYLRPPDSEG